MKLSKIAAILAGALIFFYSCEQPLSDSAATAGPVPISAGESGTLTVRVPLVSSVLQSTLEAGSGDSRAYLFARDVQIILRDSAGSELDRSEASFPGGSLDDPGALLTTELTVPWGVGYTVLVQILDEAGNVTVEGESASFNMGFDQVTLSLTLLPADPAVLTAGSRTGTLTASVYDSGSDSFTSMGGEAWFSLTPASAATAVLTVDTDGEALLFHADGQGFFQGSARRQDPDQPTVYTAPLSAGETAYAGLIILDDGAQSADYTLGYQTLTGGFLRLDLTGMAAEAGSTLSLTLTPAGETAAAASLSTTLTGSDRSLYLFEGDGLSLWEGTGSYDYTLHIDRDGSGDINRDDLILSGTLSLAAGENILAPALGAFALYSPDITGRWYCLNDETALNEDFVVMEIVADVMADGTFAVYARRHELPDPAVDPNWSNNVAADDFLPVLEGTWSLEGYELTATLVRADVFAIGVLTGSLDDAYYGGYNLDQVGLLTRSEINSYLALAAMLGYTIDVNTDVLDALFATYTQTVEEVAATAIAGGTAVTGFGATLDVVDTSGATQTRTYDLIDTYLATDLGNGDFRTPLIFP